MLDTIALTLEREQFEVLEPDRFSPSARGLLVPPYYPLGARGNFQCVQNPTKAELAAGRYLPRLTLAKRAVQGGFALTLRVEFSAPKLIFGNNFDELRSRDFEPVVDVLRRLLREMGVGIEETILRGARVSAIHYSKNVALTDYTSCSMVINELARIDLSKRLDLAKTDFRNGGHAIRYHANSLDVIFYDKMKDLERARISEKRAIERDTIGQIDLFKGARSFPKQLEVLRMEVRLGNRAKIVSVMKDIGAEVEPTFAALFDISIAQEVLDHFWDAVRRQLPLLSSAKSRKPEDILMGLARGRTAPMMPARLLRTVGLVLLVESVGVRGVQALMAQHCSARSWQRIRRDIRNLGSKECNGFQAWARVDEALKAFKPLRLKDAQTCPA